jgi:hypothetical protein
MRREKTNGFDNYIRIVEQRVSHLASHKIVPLHIKDTTTV